MCNSSWSTTKKTRKTSAGGASVLTDGCPRSWLGEVDVKFIKCQERGNKADSSLPSHLRIWKLVSWCLFAVFTTLDPRTIQSLDLVVRDNQNQLLTWRNSFSLHALKATALACRVEVRYCYCLSQWFHWKQEVIINHFTVRHNCNNMKIYSDSSIWNKYK